MSRERKTQQAEDEGGKVADGEAQRWTIREKLGVYMKQKKKEKQKGAEGMRSGRAREKKKT